MPGATRRHRHALLRLTGRGPSPSNPRFCNVCEIFAKEHPGGAEIELTLLFADVRGSTRLAERVGATEFARLMKRFYQASNEVLIESDAFIDKPVGDEGTDEYDITALGDAVNVTARLASVAPPGRSS